MNLPVTGVAPSQRDAQSAIASGGTKRTKGGDENVAILFKRGASHLSFPI
jgi:hypothetical protein